MRHFIFSTSVYATLILSTSLAQASPQLNCKALFSEQHLKPQSMDQMLQDHEMAGNPVISSRRLRFLGVGGRDVYNQTSKFRAKVSNTTMTVKFARVEPRANHESEVWAFREIESGVYAPIREISHFKGEDPFFSFIGRELFVGFVETYPVGGGKLGYRTVVYRDHAKGVDHLERFVELPRGMKDIRFAKIKAGSNKGKIQLVARPQHSDTAKGGRGKNAFIILDSIEQLSSKAVELARILHGQVRDGDWIGTNQLFPLENGDTVYLSHVAHYIDEKSGERGYYITTYSDRFPEPRIVLVRTDIEDLAATLDRKAFKRLDLVKVLFAGGFRELDAETGVLDVGAGDAEALEVKVPNLLKWYREQPAP